MVVKLKVCGVVHLDNAIELERIGVDFIGIVNDVHSPRYRPVEFISEVKKHVKSTPIVSVRIYGDIASFYNVDADYVQIHRVLKDHELDLLSTFSKKTILYVPASLEYVDYLKKAQRVTNYILFDSVNKGLKTNPKVLRILLDYHPDAGVAGGISPWNVYEYLELEPGWIDVSSGVEVSPGRKDLDLVRKLKEAIYRWRRSL